MTEINKHISWVDWAKIFGIYLVTLGHGHLVSDDARMLIYSFHMPLFFILSGMLYKKRTFKETFKRTIKTMLVPYLLISMICLCYYLVLKGFQIGLEWSDIWRRLGAICMGLGYEARGWMPVSSPMWYVIALWFVYLLTSISCNKYYEVFLTIGSIAAFVGLKKLHIDTLPPIDSALMALPFFIIGRKGKDVLFGKTPKWVWASFLLLIPAWYFIATYNGRADMCGCGFGKSLLLFYLAGIIGSLVLMTACKFIRSGGQIYASGTFLVMGFNVIAVNIAEAVWCNLFPSLQLEMGWGVVLAILILIAFYPVIILCRKHFPVIVGYR